MGSRGSIATSRQQAIQSRLQALLNRRLEIVDVLLPSGIVSPPVLGDLLSDISGTLLRSRLVHLLNLGRRRLDLECVFPRNHTIDVSLRDEIF
jgi:hypothetical protein